MTIMSAMDISDSGEHGKSTSSSVSATSIPADMDIDHSHEVSGGTITAAVFGIVKAMVGPAILYLPHSFADAGYLFAFVALWACTLLYLYSSNRLLGTWRFVRSQQQQKQIELGIEGEIEMSSLQVMDKDTSNAITGDSVASIITKRRINKGYDQVDTRSDDGVNDLQEATNTSISYPQMARMAYGETGEAIVRAGITLMQLGVCLTYFIFVPHNLSASIFTLLRIRLPLWLCLFGMVLIEIPLSSIRNVRKLVMTNILATCLIAFGLASCLFLATFSENVPEELLAESNGINITNVEDVTRQGGANLSPFNDHWYLFIGTSVLLFEGSITLCIPLQEALQVPQSEKRFPEVYYQTISSIVLFYSFFGFICWKAFGDDVSTVLTTSLPDGTLATTVQLAYSVAVIFTFPLQIFPALEIVVHLVEQRQLLGHDRQELSAWERRIICSIVISILSIVAVVEMNNLGKVVALMGSLLGAPLAFVFPPLIHSKIVPNPPTRADLTVAGIGICAMIGATLITLATWSEPGEGRR